MKRRLLAHGSARDWSLLIFQVLLTLGHLVFFGAMAYYALRSGARRWLLATPAERVVVTVVVVAVVGVVLALIGRSRRRRRAERERLKPATGTEAETPAEPNRDHR